MPHPEDDQMIAFDVSTLAWLAGAWLLASGLITACTWKVASRHAASPLAITVSSALLAFFPPLNLVLLALMSVLKRRSPP
jgi:hypothetical protein